MPSQEIEKVWNQVLTLRKPSQHGGQAPEHVFQILEAGNDGDVLFSWPPPRLFPNYISNADAVQISVSSSGQSYGDGSYFADDFARLAQNVSCSPNNSSGAVTCCTRRFRAKHTLTSEGMLRSVESVLIPYGSLVLACFKTTYQQMMSRSNGATGSPYSNATANLYPQSQAYNSQPSYHPSYNHLGQHQQQQQQHPSLGHSNPPPPSWIPLASGNSIGSTYDASGRPYHPDQLQGGHQSRTSLGSLSELADATIAYADAPPGSGPAGLAPIGIENSAGQASMRLANSHHLHHSHPMHTASPLNGHYGHGMPHQGIGPQPKRKRPSEDGSGMEGGSKPRARPTPTQKMPSDGTLDGATQAASSHPPTNQDGDKCCTGCGTVNSPEWRKGENRR